MDVSIVIPSYNTQATIAATLTSLVKQESTAQREVIVVDCSPHDEVAAIAQQFEGVRYHHESQRFNPGKGRNIGAGLARGKLLVFIDADVRLAPGAVDAAWRHHGEGRKVFGGALELDTANHRDAAAYLEHYFFNHESQAGRPLCERNNLSSALMCFERELFLKLGGFRDIPRMQDTELTERLRGQGQALYFCPDVLAFQTQDAPLKKVLNKIYINGQNLYYIRYQSGISKTRKAAFFILLPAIALAKTLRIIGRHLRHQRLANKLRTVALSPLLLLGGVYWMAGFYHALLTEEGIGKYR